jgi:hypothetical protein
MPFFIKAISLRIVERHGLSSQEGTAQGSVSILGVRELLSGNPYFNWVANFHEINILVWTYNFI